MLTFSFTLPTTRSDGTTPSDPNDTVQLAIAPVPAGGLPTDATALAAALAELTFTTLATSAPGASTASVATNPPAGDYVARAIVLDTQSPPLPGAPFYSAAFTVPDLVVNPPPPAPLPAPGMVSGLTVAVS